jgi:hypothetical protein
MKDLNPTTRRYPRSMDEAFQRDVTRAQWFYPPEVPYTFGDVVLTSAGIALWVCLAYYFANL